mmetsp:Transcript_699/g.1613  ORF Transcript_699/g.1613 Transcript_699/m.1613 type:complete len:225 (+) Transcript_699:1862-2536(+)
MSARTMSAGCARMAPMYAFVASLPVVQGSSVFPCSAEACPHKRSAPEASGSAERSPAAPSQSSVRSQLRKASRCLACVSCRARLRASFRSCSVWCAAESTLASCCNAAESVHASSFHMCWSSRATRSTPSAADPAAASLYSRSASSNASGLGICLTHACWSMHTLLAEPLARTCSAASARRRTWLAEREAPPSSVASSLASDTTCTLREPKTSVPFGPHPTRNE